MSIYTSQRLLYHNFFRFAIPFFLFGGISPSAPPSEKIKSPHFCDLVTEKAVKIGYNKAVNKECDVANTPHPIKERKYNMSVLALGKNNFDIARKSEKPVLIDFYADWCGPCRMVSPIVDEIAEEYDEYLVAKVNVDKEGELAGEFGVFSIPTLVVLKDGKVVNKVSGARPKAAILKLLEG